MQFLEDNHYIELARQGDTKAFGSLVQKHQRLVYTLALRMLKNTEEAQEAAQDTFVKVYQSLGSFEGKSKFTTWMYRVVYNECAGRLRKTKRQLTWIEDLMEKSGEPADFLDGLEILQRDERAALVKKGIELLTPAEAVVLTLFYFEELSIKEIVSITGHTESNVKVQLFRGRKHLEENLKKLSSKELIGLL
ncbi:RNA polymerase sigma factor [Algoriphagus sp. H41]|uniref:RNA polymerase sigma factor n=1 Tax=Algoriphagus oliviformis TaxID=2811231 RepID=A0ABS3C6Q3_9BACT|nr:RNA polymerase sigma factor [Algoriphagus oliviformis]MBN7812688.1 RNA polymerase sigma factor [Algoriphagus oliviformis]